MQNKRRLIVSKSFKLKYVCLYNTLIKNNNIFITLKSFCESIEDNDGSLYVQKGKVKESTFRGWIKEVNNFTLTNLYDCTSYHNSKLNYKYKQKANIMLLKKINQIDNEYKEQYNKIYNNITLLKNITLQNKKNKYSILFKLKWIFIYKQYISKYKISLTKFSSLISGNNGYGKIIQMYTIKKSTFHNWIKNLNNFIT